MKPATENRRRSISTTLRAKPSAAKTNLLLEHLANLKDEDEKREREKLQHFWDQFKECFPKDVEGGSLLDATIREAWESENLRPEIVGQPIFPVDNPMTDEHMQDRRNKALLGLCEVLRDAWRTPDLRDRAWKVSLLRWKVHAKTSKDFGDVLEEKAPPPSVLDTALVRLLDKSDELHYCKNPRCRTPYFIGHPKLKNCSRQCAAESKKEIQRRWWRAKGKAKRKSTSESRS